MTIVTPENADKQLHLLMERLDKDSVVVIDVETTGLEVHDGDFVCGIGIAQLDSDFSQYYPVAHNHNCEVERKNKKQKELEERLICDEWCKDGKYQNVDSVIIESFINILNDTDFVSTFIGHNIKFDLHFLSALGLDVGNRKLIDTLVMTRLTEPKSDDNVGVGLTATAQRRFGKEAGQYDIDLKTTMKQKKWVGKLGCDCHEGIDENNKPVDLGHGGYDRAPINLVGPYCEQDVLVTAKLYNNCLKKIINTKQTRIYELQCQLTKTLFDMEGRGVGIDNFYAKTAKNAIKIRQEFVGKQIYKLAGKEFDILSPKQVGEVLNGMNPPIHSPVKTPKGEESWNEAALINIDHRIAGLIRQYRSLAKLISTYLQPYIKKNVKHTQFYNWGTSTGRLSSQSPNFQNIPRNHFNLEEHELSDTEKTDIRGKISAMISQKGIVATQELSDDVLSTWAYIGDESYSEENDTQVSIRRLFIPRDGYKLVGFDYQQMEVRVFMSYFRNKTIDEILNKDDVDFHSEAAKLAFGIDESHDRFKEFRQYAKAVTFGTIYGIGNKKLAQQLSTTPQEAGKFKKQYFQGMKGSKEWFDKVVATAGRGDILMNRYGRVYSIDPRFAYKGVNYMVQGTSADLLTERMIEVDKYLADKKSHILVQVHDEIICEIHESELDTIPYEIQTLLEQNSKNIPLKVDMEVFTPSWATKKELKPVPAEDYIDWD
jgi:DNA polymerase I-like protein with 3'-5' exonuclease and polymerase domains